MLELIIIIIIIPDSPTSYPVNSLINGMSEWSEKCPAYVP